MEEGGGIQPHPLAGTSGVQDRVDQQT